MGNILLGSDGITIRQGIYEESSTQKTELGRFIDFEDGRRFRYCKSNGGTTKGHLVQGPPIDTAHDDTLQTSYGVSVGDKDDISIVVTTAPTANQYADGYLIVNEGTTGIGQIYKIRKNSAASPTKVWLYDAVITAILATDEVTLVKSRYLDVITCPASGNMTGVPLGVPLITITDNYYFWAQTRGYCSIVTDDNLTIGDPVEPGGTDAGSCTAVSAYTMPIIGFVAYAAVAEDYAVIDLHLE